MNADEETNLALTYYRAGNFQQAEVIFEEILERAPQDANILHLMGLIKYRYQDYHSAIEYLQKSIQFDPTNANAYYNLGLVFQAQGQLDEAITSYQKSLQLNPNYSYAYYNLGSIFRRKRQSYQAILYYQKAIQINLSFPEAYNDLGFALQEKGQLDEAIQYYQKALLLNPDLADVYYNLGTAFLEIVHLDEAITCFKKVLQLNPNDAEAYNNLGFALQEKGQLDEAIQYYQMALLLNPNLADAFNHLGLAHKERAQFDTAIKYYKRAIQIDPSFAEAYLNLGIALQGTVDFHEAISYFQKALQLKPTLADAHWNISLMLLLSGNLDEGWKKYEWRFLKKDARQSVFPQPQWDGRLLKGKSLLISAEQGVGDEIMFASCLPEVITQADHCIVECDKRLVPLFERSFPKAKVIERLNPSDGDPPDLPKTDMKIAIGSLPKFLRSHLSLFPQHQSYIVPDEQKVEIWRARFEELGTGLKIGISWRGGGKQVVKLVRSTVLNQWAGIFLVPGTHFINLQYGDCINELREVKENLRVRIHDWKDADPLKDLDGFAAQIAALDLVISVDNATVHMAGGIGIPVWTLLPFACDWRWMQDFEDTPWYKTMRLFRQSKPGDWDGVFLQVESNLKRYISTGVIPCIKYSYKSSFKTTLTVQQPVFIAPSDRTYRCAVVTPVGPRHEHLYSECLASIEKSFSDRKGNFSEIIPIKIDDSDGRLGRSRARNIGIKKAAAYGADWIFFIDADDLMAPLAFEYVAPYIEKYDGIWGSIWPIEHGEQKAKERPHQLPFLYGLKDVLTCDPFVTLQMGHFVKTSVALSSLFNESLNIGEDFDYYLRIWEKYACIKIPLPFFYNRRGFHSLGPRSANGYEWRQQVENIIKRISQRLDNFIHI
jgi:tetratricopeptide (TPR) repeat protein